MIQIVCGEVAGVAEASVVDVTVAVGNRVTTVGMQATGVVIDLAPVAVGVCVVAMVVSRVTDARVVGTVTVADSKVALCVISTLVRLQRKKQRLTMMYECIVGLR